jgi:soluble lytic murein transglycosylase-like protein
MRRLRRFAVFYRARYAARRSLTRRQPNTSEMRRNDTQWSNFKLRAAVAICTQLTLGAITFALANAADAADEPPVPVAFATVSDTATQEAGPSLADIASVLRKQFRVAHADSTNIAQAVLNAASQFAMSPVLLLAIIETESGFNRHAVSSAGAKGLMQILPTAHPQLVASGEDLSDPAENVRIGSRILRDYLDATRGDLNSALKRYSGGDKNYAERVAVRMRKFATNLNTAPDGFLKVSVSEQRCQYFCASTSPSDLTPNSQNESVQKSMPTDK